MVQKQFTFDEFKFSSVLIRDLVAEKSAISSFISRPFSTENLHQQAQEKVFDAERRTVLVQQLIAQNAGVSLSNQTHENIELLKQSNSFTITTGHQLNLWTGPLYSIYKVAQVVSLCREAQAKDPANHYIPVFWMATEDHDFEEINHLHLFGKKIAWEKEGQENRIAGKIEPTAILPFLDEIAALFRTEEEKAEIQRIANFYAESDNLAAATRKIMNHLFGEFGVVIIDGNDRELKKEFKPIVAKELKEGLVYKAVHTANEALETKGYHTQVYLRNCNLFSIESDGTRIRIGKEDNQFYKEEIKVELEDLLAQLDENPASFSPNALMRPVYQELVLPNLAYIGGGGEIAYWMQLKGVFDALNMPFPMLRVRDSFVLLRARDLNTMDELGLSLVDLKRDLQDLVREMALEEVELELELREERVRLDELKKDLLVKAKVVGQGIEGLIEAEFSKMEKSLEKIETKLIKAEKSKHEQKANKIGKLQAKIYPEKGFQERFENFLPYFLEDKGFVNKILNNLKAADKPTITILEI